jgi:hypothetical protein
MGKGMELETEMAKDWGWAQPLAKRQEQAAAGEDRRQ